MQPPVRRLAESPHPPPRAARSAGARALVAIVRIGVLLSLANGCSEFSPVQTPPNLAARCNDRDSNPAVEISFRRDILEGIFLVDRAAAPGCSCHNPTDALPVGFQMSGLDLSSFATTRRGGMNTAATIVVPGQPCASVLFLKVTQSPPLGARMPRNGPPFLSEAQINLIHDWISEGARDN